MKRSSLPFLLAAILAILAGFSFERDPSINADAFVPELRQAVKRAGFTVVTEEMASKADVPLPITVRWHPRRLHAEPEANATAQTTDGADHFGLLRDRTSRVECFVRYLDGRAQFILIRAKSGESLAAANLRTALAKAFPGFPVELEVGG